MDYKIGIDGGGTKTELILTDPAGAIVARHHAPGCSPSLAPREEILGFLQTHLDALLATRRPADPAPRVTHTLLCMAGSPLFWRELIGALHGYGAVQTCDDSHPVLELATGGRPGLALHAGTGSFVAARGPDGAAHYAGGLGWRLGDPGSAYDLGQRAAARAILEAQGWAGPSALGRAVRAAVGHEQARPLTRHFYADGATPQLVAALAPLVTAAAADGDAAATEVVRASVAALADLAQAVVARVFPGVQPHELPLGLSGVILRGPIARRAIESTLGRDWRWCIIDEPPIEGVRRLLSRL